MTKRAKPKTTNSGTAAPTTTNSTASVKPVESVEVKSNTKVATRAKKANSTTIGASKRTRSKKVTVDGLNKTVDVKEVDIDSRTITYIDPMTMAAKSEPKLSLYDRFVGWLVRITYNFRGY